MRKYRVLSTITALFLICVGLASSPSYTFSHEDGGHSSSDDPLKKG